MSNSGPVMVLEKDFTFDSSHSLPCVGEGHPCKNLHGHTFKLTIGIGGTVDPKKGWIIDFREIKSIVKEKVIDRLDHHHLNDIVENPTSENLVRWIWDELYVPIESTSEGRGELCRVILWETPTSRCVLATM